MRQHVRPAKVQENNMNQDYRNRVKKHREAGGDEKYVNVKKKAEARHNALEKKKGGRKPKQKVEYYGNRLDYDN